MSLSKEKKSLESKPVRKESLLKHFFTIDSCQTHRPNVLQQSPKFSPVKNKLKLPKISKLAED